MDLPVGMNSHCGNQNRNDENLSLGAVLTGSSCFQGSKSACSEDIGAVPQKTASGLSLVSVAVFLSCMSS